MQHTESGNKNIGRKKEMTQIESLLISITLKFQKCKEPEDRVNGEQPG